MSEKVVFKSSIGFIELLTVAFIVLKLCGVIDWPWLWVLSPLWISFFVFIVFMFVCLFIVLWREDRDNYRKR